MLTRLMFVLVLALSQIGWIGVVEEYKAVDLTPHLRQELERLKREFLQLDDLKIGDGPIAAWGRKVSADIEVRAPSSTEAPPSPMLVWKVASLFTMMSTSAAYCPCSRTESSWD